jgi:hypothetical protein
MSRTTLALVLLAAFAAVPPAPALARGGDQGGAPAASRDEEAIAFIVNLDNAKFKMSDADSIASIKRLAGIWKDAAVSKNTKSKVPGLLHWFATKKGPEAVLAAINALATMGAGAGTQKLVSLLDGLMQRKDPPADQVAAVFAGLRNAADVDPAVTRAVMKVFVEKDAATAAKAADVLGAYAGAAADVKQRLFEEMLRNCESLAANAAKPDNKPAADKWALLAPPALGALGGLSKQSFSDVAAARKWFNDKGREISAWK